MSDDASNPLAPGDHFANPLPPPSKPKGSGGPPPATPMSNNDFRKLLATPRGAGGGVQATPRRGGGGGGEGEFQKPKPKPKSKPRPKQTAEEKAEAEGAAYRDRAKERRNEANPDYTGVQDDPLLAAGISGAVPEEVRQLSIEESKFLGGDVEHTHLVKGLDFALLQKVRAEMTESVKDEEYHRGSKSSKSGAGSAIPDQVGLVAGQVTAADGKVASFRTAMARSVYDLTVKTHAQTQAQSQGGGGGGLGGDPVKPNERFASGRVSFTFDIININAGGATAVSDIPTTTMRSRSDVDAARGTSSANMMMAGRDAAVLERLSKIMVYLQLGGKSGKKAQRRKEAARGLEAAAAATTTTGSGTGGGAAVGRPAVGTGRPQQGQDVRPAAGGAVSDDEDIFGDVGREYEPTVAKKKEETTDGDKSASYFGNGHAKGEASVDVPRSKAAKMGDEAAPSLGVGGAGAGAGAGPGEGGAVSAEGGVISVDANGLAGPMPEPPAPDFKSIEPFKAHYRAYVAAGTVSVSKTKTKTERWDPNAAGSYLQTCPEFALAITAHSVTVLEAEEAAEEEAAAAKGGGGDDDGRGGDKFRMRAKPLDAAAAKAELERRAEASLATGDGYDECYAGFDGYADAVYESDDDEDGDKKTKSKEDEDGQQEDVKKTGGGGGGGGRAGLGAAGKKGGKIGSVKAMEAQRDQKLNSELGSLHKMMKEKYGDKVDAAFGGGGGGDDNDGEGVKSGKGGGSKGRGEKRGGGRDRGGGGGGDGGGGDDGDAAAGSRRGKRLKV